MTAPRKVSVRLTGDLSDDLAVLARTGIGTSDAVRRGIALLADAHRAAWDHGDVPDGQPVRVVGAWCATSDGTPAPVPHVSDASDAPVRQRPTGPQTTPHTARTDTGPANPEKETNPA